MVNIVEFEEQLSPKRKVGEGSILSTPFRADEPNEMKLKDLNFKSMPSMSQSALGNKQRHRKTASKSSMPGGEVNRVDSAVIF